MKKYGTIALLMISLMAAMPVQAGNVLIVISGADHLDLKHGGVHPTGFYLNELMQPVITLEDAGEKLTFATPDGRIPTLDKGSVNPKSFGGDVEAMKEAEERLADIKLLSPTESPIISLARAEQIGVDHFDAVFVPGGHAPMQDLVKDPALGRLLVAFHKAQKPTALVCHGPVALLSAIPNADSFVEDIEKGKAKSQPEWIYYGYKLTVLPNIVEEQVKPSFGGDEMKFYPENALKAAGANFSGTPNPIDPYVGVDHVVITGQNPASALGVGKALLEKLK